ncbi:PAS domain S-box protein [Roseomonas sp. USHLN139]|uniref:PAS domain S-box protein n=1 Tax=Roseomonas sp. USHLN139 TaxID=3081298 RepID=UPI003B0186EB
MANDFVTPPGWPAGAVAPAEQVRRFDWASTALGPCPAWPEALQAVVELILGAPLGMALLWGPRQLQIHNPAFAALAGSPLPAGLGQAGLAGWPALDRFTVPARAAALRGEAQTFLAEPLPRGAGAGPAWFDLTVSPVRGAAPAPGVAPPVAGVLVTLVEVTRRVQDEQRLRDSEARFRAFAAASPDVSYRMSPDWREMRELEGGRFLAGTPRPSTTWLDRYILAEDQPAVRQRIREAVQGRCPFDMEHRVRRPDGSLAWTHSRAVPILDAAGEILEWIGMARDITARRQAEEALRGLQARQALLLRLGDALQPEADPQQLMALAGEQLGRHLGVDRCGLAEVTAEGTRLRIGRDWSNGVLPGAAGCHPVEAFGAALRGHAEAGQVLAIAAAPQPMPGGWRAGLAVPVLQAGRWVALLYAQQAAPRAWSAEETLLLQEIAERSWAAVEHARAAAAARRNEEQLAAIFKVLPIGVGIVDRAGRLVLSNPEMRRFMPSGRMPSTDPERLWRWRGQGADGAPLAARDFPGARALRGETVVPGIEMLYTQEDGREVWTQFSAVPIRDAEGRVTGQVPVVADIDALKRSGAALQQSEERFRQFAASSSDALWIRDAASYAFEYASPAIEAVYGVTPEAVYGDPMLLHALIVPEEREAAARRVAQVAQGETVVQEYRIFRARDRSFRWIRSTGFPLRDDGGVVRRIAAIARDVTEARLLAEHQAVLLAELQHRVRNIMAVIRSVASRTARSAGSVEEYRDLMSGRLLTLARVQALLTRSANMGASIHAVIRDELVAAAGEERQFDIAGPELLLSAKAAEVLTLAVHELATNALKHGAFAVPEGRLAVRWQVARREAGDWLRLDWQESGVTLPPAGLPRRRGFGSELIEGLLPYELQGQGSLVLGPEGARCRLEFPLQGGASLLETGAPVPAGIFGGSLDMSGEADLRGQRVLVLEDDYYLASDTAHALRGAGAEVIGPWGSEPAALAALAAAPTASPTAAVVDINLGAGPSFRLVERLRQQGVPLLVITGYDEAVIPEGLQHLPRLQKPVELRRLVATLAQALGLPASG